MPLPLHLLELLPTITVSGASGVWSRDHAGNTWPATWGTEAWVLPLEPLLPGDSGGEAPAASMQRLAQAGLVWEEVEIQVGERRLPGCLIPEMGRARALRFGYRLERWAVFRVSPEGVQSIYTGRNSRMPS
jgi:hypothetical protein